ncbi:hypothetical protein ACHAPA_009379 [Fusarium lateritium]
MHFSIIAVLIYATLAHSASIFLRPPEWDYDVDIKNDFKSNRQYEVGEAIQLRWETNEDAVSLWIAQKLPTSAEYRILDSSRTDWDAEYDILDRLDGTEDCIYWFELTDLETKTIFAQTQYLNVTAPKPKSDNTETETETVATSTTTSFWQETSATSSTSLYTTTSTSSSQETNSDLEPAPKSGLSQGETAGAASGATIGGLLILGGAGWLFWRRLKKKKEDADALASYHQHQLPYDSGAKAELPGEPATGTDLSNYAKSPPGLHEAP